MKTQSKMAIAAALAIAALISGRANAQSSASFPNRTARRNYLPELREMVELRARELGIRIVIESGALVPNRPRDPGANASLEQTMNALAAEIETGAWRSIYLPVSGTPPSADRLAANARAFDALPFSRIGLEEVTAKRVTIFLREESNPASFEGKLRSGRFDPKPIYLLYSIRAPGETSALEDRFAAMQSEQMDLMQQTPPGRRADLFQQVMGVFQKLGNTDPAQRDRFLGRMLQAGMQTWQSASPEERAGMIDDTMKAMGLPQQGGDGTKSNGEEPGHNPESAQAAFSQLKTIVGALARRFDARILVDPQIIVSAAPHSQDRSLPLDQALDSLTAALPGVAWRRVYLTHEEIDRGLAPGKLASAVRTLVHPRLGSFVLENPAALSITTYRRHDPVSQGFQEELAADGFDAKPVYILYAIAPSARERYAALIEQQWEMMFAMSSDQLAQAMQNGVRTYHSADPSDRPQMVGLPIVAGMMAVWMPRAAKEREGGANP